MCCSCILLEHFAEFHPHLFRKKLCMDPNVFDCILDQISNHVIFQSKSNNLQLPVAVQLAIFLHCAGHYGNAISPEDIAQWACVSVGSVINCTHCIRKTAFLGYRHHRPHDLWTDLYSLYKLINSVQLCRCLTTNILATLLLHVFGNSHYT